MRKEYVFLVYRWVKSFQNSGSIFSQKIQVARPSEGFAHYIPAEFHSNGIDLESFLKPNETLMIDVILDRQISKNTFLIDKFGESQSEDGEFKHRKV